MTSKAELLPFSAGGNGNVSKCQAAGAFGFAFRLIRHTYSQQRLGLLAHSAICWKPKHKTLREHVTGENKHANKCDRKRGCVFSVRTTARSHPDGDSRRVERPKDSRAPVETVISGVKKNEGEEEERREEEILFELSDISYIMICTMETCCERKWRGTSRVRE